MIQMQSKARLTEDMFNFSIAASNGRSTYILNP